MKLQVNWKHIPKEFNKAAYDANGRVYAYKGEVDTTDSMWYPVNGGSSLRLEEDQIVSQSYDYLWSQSLIERPTEDTQEEITLTLRDQIAISILPAVYTTYCKNIEEWRYGVALDAYMMADAMLAARTHKQGEWNAPEN